jgi:hypothetical protein
LVTASLSAIAKSVPYVNAYLIGCLIEYLTSYFGK